MEEVVIDDIDYKDVVQFEACNNFCEDSSNNDVREESPCTLNYSDLKDIRESRMLNDSIVNAVEKNADEAIHKNKWVTRSRTRARIEFSSLQLYSICSSSPQL